LRLMHTAPMDELLRGVSVGTDEAESIGAYHHGTLYPEITQPTGSADLQDPAARPSMETSSDRPQEPGAASSTDGIEFTGARVGASDPGAQGAGVANG
jgi:hypothetical protein